MADRKDWYFQQLVQENELDESQDGMEQADFNQVVDVGLAAVDGDNDSGGIHEGLVGSNGGGLVVDVTLGSAYDNQGRRVRVPTNLSVDISVTGQTGIGVGGTPTGGFSTAPGVGLKRWVSVFVVFERDLQDPRIDGTLATVYFERNESFRFVVAMGLPAASPSDKAVPTTGQILLGDFRITDANIIDAVDVSRRHSWIRRVSGGAPTTRVGSGYSVRGIDIDDGIRSVVEQLLGYYNDHADGTADQHVGSDIEFTPNATLWADSSGIAATDVEAAINEIVSDLANVAGAARINAAASGTWIDGSTNPAGTVQARINNIISNLGSGTAGAAKVSAADLAGWNDGSSVSPGTKSVQNMLAGIVSALGLQTGSGGSDKVGSGAAAGSPNALVAGSVFDHLGYLLTELNAHENQTPGAHAASAISYSPGGNIAATTAQNAINELDAEKGGLALNNAWTGANGFTTHTTTFGASLLAAVADYLTARTQVTVGWTANDDKVLLLYLPPTAAGIAPVRVYAQIRSATSTSGSIQIVWNAIWNNTTQLWSRDDAALAYAHRLTMGYSEIDGSSTPPNSFFSFTRQTSFAPWVDSGWLEKSFSAETYFSAGVQLQMHDGRIRFSNPDATGSGSNDTVSETGAGASSNVLAAKNLIKAWYVTNTGTLGAVNPSSSNRWNVTSVAETGGFHNVVWTHSAPGTGDQAVIGSIDGTATPADNGYITVLNTSVNGATIYGWRGNDVGGVGTQAHSFVTRRVSVIRLFQDSTV